MSERSRSASRVLIALLATACDGPSVAIPLKPPRVVPTDASDRDDIDDEAEERTRGMACQQDSDCPGLENPICSRTLGCVECTSTADCPTGEICIEFIGDCEDPPRRR